MGTSLCRIAGNQKLRSEKILEGDGFYAFLEMRGQEWNHFSILCFTLAAVEPVSAAELSKPQEFPYADGQTAFLELSRLE